MKREPKIHLADGMKRTRCGWRPTKRKWDRHVVDDDIIDYEFNMCRMCVFVVTGKFPPPRKP